jgi:cellulose/xylan binding protein with CBM9 domain
MIAELMVDALVVRRAEFSLEEPWSVPAGCEPVPLRLATDGSAPRLATAVTVYFDDVCLNVLFTGADDHVVATHFLHDAPLYEEDVVEAFLAPETLTDYFELEVSPFGTLFDARIESPDGDRKTMKADRAWTCEGLFAAVRRVDTFEVILRIPFASLGRTTPVSGETWRANFFRIDRSPSTDEFSAWQPTMRVPPDFHVPAAFGTLRFA